jgi:tetratricopeptide (TPR) repeat protein
MRKPCGAALAAVFLLTATPLLAQNPCPGYSVVVNTPEDQLMLAINGAEKPEDQIAALDKFTQANADSKFMNCANEYYTIAYLKLGNFDKAIEYGEKDLAANYQDLSLLVNLTKAYVGAGKATDQAFALIANAPDQIKKETSPAHPSNASDADWQKIQQDAAELAKDVTAYMGYAFFQLLPRVTDPAKRITLLGQFEKAYPDAGSQYAAQINYQYFMAYEMAGQNDKADPYGEKALTTDANNVQVLNLVAYDYANLRTNLEKATDYAKKVVTLVPAMKKPEGQTDDQFKAEQNNQLGMAHLTLGYVSFQKAALAKTRRVAPAIQELKAAGDLLSGNPLQGAALYYLANCYEYQVPPSHRDALEALNKAVAIQSPWQAPARDLLAKVKVAK